MSRDEIACRLASIFADIHSRDEVAKDKNAKIYRIPWTKITGYEEEKLTEEEFKYIEKINSLYIEPLLGIQDESGKTIKKGRIEFIEDIAESNPTAIYKHLKALAEQEGEFSYREYETQDDFGRPIKGKAVTGYKTSSKRKRWIIVDHLGLMKKEKGLNKKENIDKFIEEYCRGLRNTCGFTFVLLSQQNRSMKSVDRMKFTGEQLQPQAEDAKDTSSLEETCDMLIAIFNPNSMTHLTNHLGYKLADFNGGYRSIHVIVSRFTKTPITKCVFFNSSTGKFAELSKPHTKELEHQIELIKRLK